MKITKKDLKPLVQKLRFKYRISILNEHTLEEVWYARLSRFGVFLYGSSFVLITFILLTILILNTPIASYLPGFQDSGNRTKIIQESMAVDSLLNQSKLQDGYLAIIKSIITGDIKPDSIASLDTVALKERAQKIIEKSSREKNFVEEFENEEKYNLSTISVEENHNTVVFFRPTRGIISSGFNPSEQSFGVSIITSPGESVLSVLSGTVIYTAFTFDYGWVVHVQHDNNYLSIYKNNTQVLCRVGQNVKAGETIAITGSKGTKNNGEHFYFELWKQGNPVNPEEEILF